MKDNEIEECYSPLDHAVKIFLGGAREKMEFETLVISRGQRIDEINGLIVL